jgi:hypothetical protein
MEAVPPTQLIANGVLALDQVLRYWVLVPDHDL